MKYKNMTPEKIKEAIDAIFDRTQNELQERKINMWRYCLSIGGLIKYSTPFNSICSNRECTNCQEIHHLLEAELKTQLKKDFGDET